MAAMGPDLKHVPPILAFVVEPLVEHLHYLHKIVPSAATVGTCDTAMAEQRTDYRSSELTHSFGYPSDPKDR